MFSLNTKQVITHQQFESHKHITFASRTAISGLLTTSIGRIPLDINGKEVTVGNPRNQMLLHCLRKTRPSNMSQPRSGAFLPTDTVA